MPRATGPIGYIEHRSPMKDETGKYLIHPQFVYRDVYDFKNMRDGMRQHHQMVTSQFLAAIQSIKDETMMALSKFFAGDNSSSVCTFWYNLLYDIYLTTKMAHHYST